MKKSVILVGLFCSSLFAGDVIVSPGSGSGSSDAAKLQGREISTNAPTNGQSLLYNSTLRQWLPSDVAVSEIVTSNSLPVEFVISGAGHTAVNGSYALDGTRNGHNAYHIIPNPNGFQLGEIYRANSGAWILTDSDSTDHQYATTQTNLTSPVGGTWVAGTGALPVPTITVGSSDATKFYLYAGKWLYRPRVNGERGAPMVGEIDGLDIKDTHSVASVKPDIRTLVRTDAGDDTVLDWGNNQLLGYPGGTVGNGNAVVTVDWTKKQLLSNGTDIALDWSDAAAVQISGSTIGTAAFTDSTAYDAAGAAAAITLSGLGGVSTTRAINSKALSGDITLNASDVGADASGAAAAVISDTAYDATSWDAVTGIAPSKNAVRDKVETLAPLTSPTFTGTVTSPNFTLSGNQSAAAWTTNGLRLKGIAGTLTDTTSSGTVAAAYTNKLGGNTIAASSATTFTDYISGYFSEPVQGTNVTLTNKWALGADSLYVGTSNPLKVTSAGVLSATSPAFTTGINDSNGNTLFGLTATSSAVNYVTITNAATGNKPVIGTNASNMVLDPSGGIVVLGSSTGIKQIHNWDSSCQLAFSASGGTTSLSATTDSTSSTTGSLKTAGGLGVAKAVNVGTTLNVTGVSTLAGGGTSTTATAGDNTTQIATTAFVKAAVPTASYRTILQTNGKLVGGVTANTYYLSATNGTPVASAGTIAFAADLINIVGADYPTVNGGTTTMRVRAELGANSVAPAITFTVGLYPVTVAGSASNFTYTLGTVISGSTVAIATPSASTVTMGASTDFAIPSDGAYVIGVVTNGTVASTSINMLTAHLQMKN